jgi:translation initiation factor 1
MYGQTINTEIAKKRADNCKKKKFFSQNMHIRLQQRNGRKSLTTIQGLNKKFDHEKILKYLKKEFCCNGCVVEDVNLGTIIQIQGDQRQNSLDFLIKERIAERQIIKIHGI